MIFGNLIDRSSRVSAAHLRAIGRVIVNWSVLEQYIVVGISSILSITIGQTLALFTDMKSANQKLKMLTQCFNETFPEDHEAMKIMSEFEKKIEDLHALRNKVAHGVWGHDNYENLDEIHSLRFALKSLGRSEWKVSILATRELNEAAARMLQVSQALGLFMRRYQHKSRRISNKNETQ